MSQVYFPIIHISNQYLKQQSSKSFTKNEPMKSLNIQGKQLSFITGKNISINDLKNDYLSLMLTPQANVNKNNKTKMSYIVNSAKMPSIYKSHSSLVNRPSIRYQCSSLMEKINKTIDEPAQSSNVQLNQHDIQKLNKMTQSYETKRKIDSTVKEIIVQELYKAKLWQLNKAKSQINIITGNNKEKAKNIIKIRKKIRLKENNTKDDDEKISNKCKIALLKPIEWNFIDLDKLRNPNRKRILISKYKDPKEVIEDASLMKKIYADNIKFLPGKLLQIKDEEDIQ